MRKILPILLSTALFFTSFSVKSYAQSVQISITEKPEVDVILTANTKTIDLIFIRISLLVFLSSIFIWLLKYICLFPTYILNLINS